MKKSRGLLRWQVCALVGAVVLASTMGGCPLSSIFGALTSPLTVTAASSGEPTVDKTINLSATISGGTTPYVVAWTLASGPAATITNASLPAASFKPIAVGTYVFDVNVTDSAGFAATGSAQVQVIVGDIQFVAVCSSSSSCSVKVPGNPAVVQTGSSRNEIVGFEANVSVSDPQFSNDDTTEMTVMYEVASVPSAARLQDVSLDREFDTFSNFPLMNNMTIRPNPIGTFKTLNNLAALVDNVGVLVPGDYTFRASVTNANGLVRTRELLVTLVSPGVNGILSAGDSTGPATYAVKTLPAGSPGKVTDKVMTPGQTATMTLSFYPASTTQYRFFLKDNDLLVPTGFVTPATSSLSPAAAPQDVALTIGGSGMAPGTYSLWFEYFDDLGNANTQQVMVNPPDTGGVPVRFHVTNDFLTATTPINAVFVGQASNAARYPTPYEGWSGDPTGTYGSTSVLADVNGDGALDIITLTSRGFDINTRGFVDGSAKLGTHPDNSGNFGPALPLTDIQVEGVNSTGDPGGTPIGLAVGDLNGDSFPDVAVSVMGSAGAPNYVKIYFHTGDYGQPYSQHDDQTLVIDPPLYHRYFRGPNGDLSASAPFPLATPVASVRTVFGAQIAIAPVFGADTQPDLIITDPGFSSLEFYDAGAGPRPAALKNFYGAMEGRVYIFKGGATGNLKPNRPDIITSDITEYGVYTAGPVASGVDTIVEPTATKLYDAVYTGKTFDQLGYALAANAKGFAVGSPLAYADGRPFATYTLSKTGTRVPDNSTVTTFVGGVIRVYEFDSNGSGLTVGNVLVSIPVGTNVDLPDQALLKLRDAINADSANALVAAVVDAKDPETLILTSVFTALDATVRGADTLTATFGTVGTFSTGTFSRDGIVYFVAKDTASGTALTNPIKGIMNSDMGLGRALAIGDMDGTGTTPDILMAAMDDGSALAVNDHSTVFDGAVFYALNGATTLTAITNVGEDTGLAPSTTTTVASPRVGASIALGDINGDGKDEAFFTEPGFDRIYMIKGATTPATKPDYTFFGVTFLDATILEPAGGSLRTVGSFLIGDITGDTEVDWLFLDSDVNFGFAGFKH
jgi:hypothetical protein